MMKVYISEGQGFHVRIPVPDKDFVDFDHVSAHVRSNRQLGLSAHGAGWGGGTQHLAGTDLWQAVLVLIPICSQAESNIRLMKHEWPHFFKQILNNDQVLSCQNGTLNNDFSVLYVQKLIPGITRICLRKKFEKSIIFFENCSFWYPKREPEFKKQTNKNRKKEETNKQTKTVFPVSQ